VEPKQSVIPLITDFLSIEHVPSNQERREHVNISLTWNILNWVSDRLEQQDRAEFLQLTENCPPDQFLTDHLRTMKEPAKRRVFHALDEVIFGQARSIGMRIFHSVLVLVRLAQWEEEPRGAELYEQLGKELALRINVLRGKKRAPLDPKMRAFKDEVKAEYSLLKNVLRSRDSANGRVLPFHGLLSLAEEHIKAHPLAFPRLASNLTSFRTVVQKDNEWLTQRNMTPTAFAHEFLAVATNRTAESLRQELSRMPRRKL
jgi:hypothetical protein